MTRPVPDVINRHRAISTGAVVVLAVVLCCVISPGSAPLGVVLNGVRAQAGGYYNRNIKTYYEYQNGHAA